MIKMRVMDRIYSAYELNLNEGELSKIIMIVKILMERNNSIVFGAENIKRC